MLYYSVFCNVSCNVRFWKYFRKICNITWSEEEKIIIKTEVKVQQRGKPDEKAIDKGFRLIWRHFLS